MRQLNWKENPYYGQIREGNLKEKRKNEKKKKKETLICVKTAFEPLG